MKKILLYSVLIVVSFSCSKTFLDEVPNDVLAPENVYINKVGFERGLYGLYNQVRQERGGYFQDGVGADPENDITNGIMMVGVDNAYTNNASADNENYYNFFSTGGSISLVANGYNSKLFLWLYKVINGANTIIIRSNNSGIDWTDKEKNQIVGEAKIMRAWAYRHLTFLWGNVPLVLEESSGSNVRTDYTRDSVSIIRKQMEQDLLWAEANMSDNAIAEGRFAKGVATHYLSELYLTEGRYQDALDKANSLINNGMYSLVKSRYGVNQNGAGSAFTDMFLDGNSNRSQGNTEALYVLQNTYPKSTGSDANIMRRMWVSAYDKISSPVITVTSTNGGRGLGRYAVTGYGLKVYNASVDGRIGSSPTDQRGGATNGIYAWRFSWNYSNSGSPLSLKLNYLNKDEQTKNNLWPCTRKWDWAAVDNPTINSGYNCQIYLRLAETYLFKAEAQYYLGDLAGAALTINELRKRAGAPEIQASDVDIEFILDERSRELFSEEHRRYTLLRIRDPKNPTLPIWIRRTNTYNKVIANNVPVLPTDTLLPIPQIVIDANLTKVMPQNPGYN